MGTYPNKATQFTTGIVAATAGSKGGKVRSKGKKYAATLRELKKKAKISPEVYKNLVNLMEEPECIMVLAG